MHRCGLRPAGPARPHWTLHPSPGERCAPLTLAQADGNRSKTLVLLLKGGTYLETGKHDSVGKGAGCPTDLFSLNGNETAMQWDYRRLPSDPACIPLGTPRGLQPGVSLRSD